MTGYYLTPGEQRARKGSTLEGDGRAGGVPLDKSGGPILFAHFAKRGG
jgi:hypothetical protein